MNSFRFLNLHKFVTDNSIKLEIWNISIMELWVIAVQPL